jgi:hypothetical protein
VALLVVLIALVAANTRQVKLSWLLGIFTSVVFRSRTRRRRPA